ncbi:MAG: HAD-IC family P-type ATPase [Armatimonadetes bacterium]|nr:HAD-IC family P-type ATPase [Armatimonadota bacterium]
METPVWHALPPRDVITRLQSREEGLADREAERRREEFGANAIETRERFSAARLLLSQLTSPLIIILLIAAGISFATGHTLDAWVILAIVILNTLIGFFQEYKAERALAALRALAAPQATVLREGRPVQVKAADLVPGDVVILAAGDRVPADARVLEAANLHAEEAALTGESQAVRKRPDPAPESAPLADQHGMLFLGTTVVTGRGRAVITGTGMRTQMGAIAREVQEAGATRTPLQRKLEALGTRLGIAAILLALLLVVVGAIRDIPLEDLFFTGVAAAVSFIPEGLPTVVTVVLAVGVRRMVRRHAIVRRLPAVETLGSATFICTDKTATLTKNEMTVRALWLPTGPVQVAGEGYAPEGGFRRGGDHLDPETHPGLALLLRAGALCNDARLLCEEGRWRVSGDPTEGALIVAAEKAGLHHEELQREIPRLDEIPFDPDQRYMATLNAGPDGARWLFVKGAPERLLGMCSHVAAEEEAPFEAARPLTPEDRDRVRRANEDLARQALRVLAIAYRRLPPDAGNIRAADAEGGLTLLGLAGMIDPPRPEARPAIEAARRAGIEVMMITGDHRLTAEAIAGQLGLLRGGREVLEGREVGAMPDEELSRRVERIAVVARAEPAHKLRLVKALQELGHIAAMTGDGVNDAPALKRADIGIAMGISGTDVAREASDLVLADDNFATIVAAIEEGRVIFNNIRRVVSYLLATNSGEILTLLASITAGLPLPLLPLQILWVNLITDGAPTLALSQEPGHGSVLDQPPRRPDTPILSRALVYRLAFVALFMTAGTVGIFLYGLETGPVDRARTLAFATMAVFQLFNVYNNRSLNDSIFRIGVWSNRWVNWGVLASAGLLALAIHSGFLHRALGTVPLSAAEWAAILLVSASVLVAEEIRKAVVPGLFGLERERMGRAVAVSR